MFQLYLRNSQWHPCSENLQVHPFTKLSELVVYVSLAFNIYVYIHIYVHILKVTMKIYECIFIESGPIALKLGSYIYIYM